MEQDPGDHGWKRDDGDDLYQDALVSALGAFEQLRDQASFRPWLYRIIVNQFRNRMRSSWFRRRQPWTEQMYAHLRKIDTGGRCGQVFRDYAYTNEAEFFAVATESFFEKPEQMKKLTPDLYAELERFYGRQEK